MLQKTNTMKSRLISRRNYFKDSVRLKKYNNNINGFAKTEFLKTRLKSFEQF